jgi:Zinc carboxypeptidase
MRLFPSTWTAPASVMSALALAGCSRAAENQPSPSLTAVGGCCDSAVLANGLRIAERYRVAAIADRRFTHAELWRAIGPFTSSSSFRIREIGRSIQGKEIRAVTFGRGTTTVLLWSQMHGDESTATMALADIFRFLAEADGDPLRERLAERLTITFVPMLNPDGAELFQRENAAGIDVNRDGRRLVTPEGRALKAIRDSLNPQFGFNLHDQGARFRVGESGRQAGIAILAPAYDEARSYNDVRSRARLVAATIARTLDGEIPGRIARYDDTFNPRAFGDLMQLWGTSTVLIESGALPADPQKQRLRTINVVAILAALDAIATGGIAGASPDWYDRLPFNTSGASDLLIRGGNLVLPGEPPMVVDIAINFDDPLAQTGGRVREAGDLQTAVGLDTLDATGLFLHPSPSTLTSRGRGSWLRIGAAASFELRRGEAPGSPLVRRIP